MPIPSLAMETQLLIKRLRECEPGDVILWDELKKACGKDCRTEANGLLQSAKRICERESQIAFETITGKGVRRLKNDEIPGATRKFIRSAHKRIGRGISKLMCTDPDTLDGTAKAQYHLSGTMLHFLRKASSGRTITRIAQLSQTETLKFDDTLKLFQGGSESKE